WTLWCMWAVRRETRPHPYEAPGVVGTACGRPQHDREIPLSVPGTPRSSPHPSFIAATATAPPVVSGPAPGATTVRHDLQWVVFNKTGPTYGRLDTEVSGPLPQVVRAWSDQLRRNPGADGAYSGTNKPGADPAGLPV